MIRRDVGDRRGVRTLPQRLELKAAQLHDHPRIGRNLGELPQERDADVAPDEYLAARAAKYLARQRRGGRLAAAARDSYDARGAARQEQLRGAAHAQTAAARLHEKRHFWRHPGAYVHDVTPTEQVEWVSAEGERDRDAGELLQALGQLGRDATIGRTHVGPVRRQVVDQVG